MKHVTLQTVATVLIAAAWAWCGLRAAPAHAQVSWEVDPSDFQYSMDVVIEYRLNGGTSSNPEDRVAAFVGDDVRGVAAPVETASGTRYYLLAYANASGETVTFKAYDADIDFVLDLEGSVEFDIDGSVGGTADPLVSEVTVSAPGSPIPASPVDGFESTSDSVTLVWNGEDLAAEYDLQVAEDEAFATLVEDQSALSDTTFVLSGLESGVTRFWRLRAVGPGGTSAWSSGWSLSTSASAAVELLSPADGAQDIATSVQLLWSANATPEFDVQVATNAAFASPVVEELSLGRISYVLRDLMGSTTYFWRVRASGTATWSEVRSFTTVAVAPPGLAVLTSPTDGTLLPDPAATLAWDRAERALAYDLEVSLTPSFTSIFLNVTGLAETRYELNTLSRDRQYFWRVRGNGSGGSGPWSATFSFSVASGLAPLVPPTLIEPADHATERDRSLNLRWQLVQEATSYQVEVSSDEAFSTLVYAQSGLVGDSYEISGLAESTTYFWRVRGFRDAEVSAWSSVYRFTTAAPVVVELPGVPTGAHPPSGTHLTSNSVQVSWAAVDGATGYVLQVATDASFATLTTEVSLTGTQSTITGISPNQDYHWRVRAVNSAGPGEWSGAFTFRYVESTSVGVATLLAPPDGALDQPYQSVWLVWSGPADATSFQVQISTDPGFASVFREEAVSGSPLELRELAGGREYHWRVRARRGSDIGDWSGAFRFLTMAGIPAAPALLAPADGSTSQPPSLWLVWMNDPDAQSYELEVTPDGASSISYPDLSAPTFQLSGLVGNTVHTWRVRSKNAAGIGPWSIAFRFTTASTVDRESQDALPETWALGVPYPNPFNPTARIPIDVPQQGVVRLTLWDLTGRLVRVLQDRTMTPGRHEVLLRASDLPSATYLLRLEHPEGGASRPLVLHK